MGFLGIYRTARLLRNRYLRPDLGDRSRRWRRFYSQFVRAGDLVFDIGANRGDRTEVFVEMGARVVAVEPLPSLATRLRRIYRYSQVNVEPVGIGRAPSTLPLRVCSTDAVFIVFQRTSLRADPRRTAAFVGPRGNGADRDCRQPDRKNTGCPRFSRSTWRDSRATCWPG